MNCKLTKKFQNLSNHIEKKNYQSKIKLKSQNRDLINLMKQLTNQIKKWNQNQMIDILQA